jgi:hypothetical protein
VAGSCERGDESTGSIKNGESLDYLNDCYLVKDLLVKQLVHSLVSSAGVLLVSLHFVYRVQYH